MWEHFKWNSCYNQREIGGVATLKDPRVTLVGKDSHLNSMWMCRCKSSFDFHFSSIFTVSSLHTCATAGSLALHVHFLSHAVALELTQIHTLVSHVLVKYLSFPPLNLRPLISVLSNFNLTHIITIHHLLRFN